LNRLFCFYRPRQTLSDQDALCLRRIVMPTQSREVRLASRPQGVPTLDNFSFATVDVSDPQPGEVLVRNVCMSVDPYMRGRMNEGKSYVPPFQIGQPLEGGAVGRVVASQDEKLPVGTFVQSIYGWREPMSLQPRNCKSLTPAWRHLSFPRHIGCHRLHRMDRPVPRRRLE